MIPDLLRRVAGNAVSGDPYYSAVSLLLHFNGANGSTTFTDSSSNNLTVTPSGNAQISTAQSKFGGAAGYFDGNGDYIEPVSTTNVSFGTGDFTVEFWFYTSNATTQQNIIDKLGGSINAIYMAPNSQIRYFNGSTDAITGSTLSASTWYHIALVRYSGVTKLYLNGTQTGSSYTDSQNYANSGNVRIGAAFNGTCSVNGYIDDLRITKGLARYTANFTVPSAPFPDRTGSIEADAYFPQTSLLLHMDGTNASTSFVDSGPNALAVTASGNAQISTTQSKFGGAAGAFDGNGDYVSLPNSSLFTFTGDFTVEGWVYINSLPTSGNYAGLFFSRGNGATDSAFQFYMYNNAGTYRLDQTLSVGSTDYGLTFNFSTAPSANTWNHFAFVRNGSNVYSFWNGVQVGATQTVSGALNATTYAPTVGGRAGPWPGLWLNGYIDEFRVTKAARYTSNFTPRAKAFPDIYNPYKTLPVSGAALWLDGADSSSLFTDAGVTPVKVNGDLVYQWNDKSGNSRHATQTTSGNRPTWVPPASGRNGLGAVGVNGSQYPIVPSDTNLALGAGDFTVEGWIKFASLPAAQCGLIDYQASGGFSLYYTTPAYFSVPANNLVVSNRITGQFQSYWLPTANSWNHIAVCRSGTSLRVFVNGTQLGSTITTSTSYAAGNIWIGSGLNGAFQNVIIYKGQALYTANFTPWMS